MLLDHNTVSYKNFEQMYKAIGLNRHAPNMFIEEREVKKLTRTLRGVSLKERNRNNPFMSKERTESGGGCNI